MDGGGHRPGAAVAADPVVGLAARSPPAFRSIGSRHAAAPAVATGRAGVAELRRALDGEDFHEVEARLCAMAGVERIEQVIARLDDPVQRQVLQDLQQARWGGQGDPVRCGPACAAPSVTDRTGRRRRVPPTRPGAAVSAAANLNRRRLRALLECIHFRGNPRMTAAAADKKKLPLHWKMGIGFAIGLVLGLTVHALGGSVGVCRPVPSGSWTTSPPRRRACSST